MDTFEYSIGAAGPCVKTGSSLEGAVEAARQRLEDLGENEKPREEAKQAHIYRMVNRDNRRFVGYVLANGEFLDKRV